MPKPIHTAADRERKRAYDREWYEKHATQVLTRNAAQKRKLQRWYAEYKAMLKCQQCGENHPATLVFHHRDASQKEISVAQAIHDGWNVEHILEEIAKCDVLCTNCHRRLHGNLWSASD
jgi:hypothetical protein